MGDSNPRPKIFLSFFLSFFCAGAVCGSGARCPGASAPPHRAADSRAHVRLVGLAVPDYINSKPPATKGLQARHSGRLGADAPRWKKWAVGSTPNLRLGIQKLKAGNPTRDFGAAVSEP